MPVRIWHLADTVGFRNLNCSAPSQNLSPAASGVLVLFQAIPVAQWQALDLNLCPSLGRTRYKSQGRSYGRQLVGWARAMKAVRSGTDLELQTGGRQVPPCSVITSVSTRYLTRQGSSPQPSSSSIVPTPDVLLLSAVPCPPFPSSPTTPRSSHASAASSAVPFRYIHHVRRCDAACPPSGQLPCRSSSIPALIDPRNS